MEAPTIMLSSGVGGVFTVPRDKILPYFKGFRQDEYPTTFAPLLLSPSTIFTKYQMLCRKRKKEAGKGRVFLCQVCVYWGGRTLFWL